MQKILLVALLTFVVLATFIILGTKTFVVEPFESAVIESPISSSIKVRPPGNWFKFPWNTVHIYDMSETSSRHELEVLDKDSISINIALVARFSPIRENLGILHVNSGKSYQLDFVDPYIILTTKEIASNYSAEELWVSQRFEFETILTDNITSALSKQHVVLKSLIVISINIPAELEEAIRENYHETDPDESNEPEETSNSENTVRT
jgi:regulator of protease activity HflC (stomatin/prohibitin superfamily)